MIPAGRAKKCRNCLFPLDNGTKFVYNNIAIGSGRLIALPQ